MILRLLVLVLRAAAGDRAGARRALGEGLTANPGAPLVESLSAELGP